MDKQVKEVWNKALSEFDRDIYSKLKPIVSLREKSRYKRNVGQIEVLNG